MCGIIAALFQEPNNDCYIYLYEGLKQLQNRGYDSAGISTMIGNIINTTKYASTDDKNALEYLNENGEIHEKSTIGIAHTRWATHGAKTDGNSHPHISMDGKFSLVHNGIIENYQLLKDMLIKNGYIFKSQTDTEVIVNLLSYHYSLLCKNNQYEENNVVSAIKNSIKCLEGTWGLVILCSDTSETLYCTRQGSPILISSNDKIALIVSEQSGFCGKAMNYFALDNHDICVIKKENGKIKMTTKNDYVSIPIVETNHQLTPDPYSHWTLKEINEQPESILRAISMGGRLLSDNEVKMGGLEENKEELMGVDNLILLGCGTSYHAGMIGVHYFKDICDFNSVMLFDGAEFNVLDIPKNGKSALVLLSQSGETKDLHRCIQIGKDHGLFLIGVVNVVDSLIAREVNCGCYLNAGREVAVASTKSYTSQVIILSLIAVWFSQKKKTNKLKRQQYIKDLRKLSFDFEQTITRMDTEINENIINLFNHSSCFILGKCKSESIAREGALKIKEISYIHAEGYSTSSLKHGPFALLTKDFPVIMVSPNDEHLVKCENAYEEIKSRHATILFITDDDKENHKNKENILIVSKNKTFADLLCIIPLQLLSYYLSLNRGLNPDMPRNLAKVVTVE